MIFRIYRAILFRIIRFLTLNKIKSNQEKCIYLTFDDGPEPGITEQVLTLLDQYGAKATFFNIGDKCNKYPVLVKKIVEKGHSIGNHSYSHSNGLLTNTKDYLDDIDKCYSVQPTYLLRPPFGGLTILEYLKLRKKYKIVLWNKGSNDHVNEMTDYQKEIDRMIKLTEPGDIVLFHDKDEHAKQTLNILPHYLDYLHKNNYKMLAIR